MAYTKKEIALSEAQIKKLKTAIKNKKAVSLTVASRGKYKMVPLMLTKGQVKVKNPRKINLSVRQVNALTDKQGGILPFLLPIISGIVTSLTKGKGVQNSPNSEQDPSGGFIFNLVKMLAPGVLKGVMGKLGMGDNSDDAIIAELANQIEHDLQQGVHKAAGSGIFNFGEGINNFGASVKKKM